MVRDEPEGKIQPTIEQSLSILVGCGETLLLIRAGDQRHFIGRRGEVEVSLSAGHRCLYKILKGAERMFIYNDTLEVRGSDLGPSLYKESGSELRRDVSEQLAVLSGAQPRAEARNGGVFDIREQVGAGSPWQSADSLLEDG